MLRPAILFKEPTADSSYENTLRENGYIAKCVPVLHTVHINIDGLVEYLSNAKEVGIYGIIVTSKRSCESFGKAMARLCSGFGISVAPEAPLGR
jgi:uroporphyrinogen-III synthase